MRAALALTVGVLVMGASGCTGDDEPSEDPASAPFSQETTLACLRNEGATIAGLRPSDQQRRALRDLAQGRTVEVRLGGTDIALAFAPDVAAADLLVELLTVPGNPYAINRRGNVVVLYERGGTDSVMLLDGCISARGSG